jgi:hypothetical protein
VKRRPTTAAPSTGTLEVFRNMIGQYMLGLGKPNYSPPLKKTF